MLRRGAQKDFLLAFGAVMGIVSVWQYVEAAKAAKKASQEHERLLATLARIETKLGGKA